MSFFNKKADKPWLKTPEKSPAEVVAELAMEEDTSEEYEEEEEDVRTIFDVGDIVNLPTEDRDMTVLEVSEAGVKCFWFDEDGAPQTFVFPSAVLNEV